MRRSLKAFNAELYAFPSTTPIPLNKTLDLQLAKGPATKKPAKGSIQFNFGGPGNVGRLSLMMQAADLLP